jgi:hypothetical protein
MRYPLFFTHGGLVAGRGFIAHVELHGRCVLDDADGEVWFFGVNPGGLAEGASTQGEAQAAFLNGIRDIVSSLAAEAPDFERFSESVHRFVFDVNRPYERIWLEAVAAVRSGSVPAEGYRKVEAGREPTVSVELVHSELPGAHATTKPNPSLNSEDELLYACA